MEKVKVMSRPRKKPEYNSEIIMQELLNAVKDCYYSSDRKDSNSLRHVAEEFDFTHLKARKLLITAGVYHTDISDQVNQLKKDGKKIPEIMAITGLKRASVHSYLPYTKMVYNANELSMNAERIRKYREREHTLKKIADAIENESPFINDIVWTALIVFESYLFRTVRDLKFKYKIIGQEIFVDRKEKSITRATVDLALSKALEMEGNISGPKKLNVFGESYIYAIFKRFGIVR